MSVNHHFLAKTTTDSVLANFKSGAWKCVNDVGVDFYRVGCDSTFPSPDAAFYDDVKKLMVSFEFKPPTETKRGILTGLGQSIAYLNSSNLSYLVIPQTLEDFQIGAYMTDLFQKQIEENLPVGLIIYENNTPTNVQLIHNVNVLASQVEFKALVNERFWAKHQDMPLPLFHLLLYCFYRKKTESSMTEDPFSFCWDNYMFPKSNQTNITTTPVRDMRGDVITTLGRNKPLTYNEKKIAKIDLLHGATKAAAIADFKVKEKSGYNGNGGSMSVRKYCMAFLRHIGVVDSTNSITDLGFKLFHLGLVNGPNSKVFRDYFTQVVLLTGHHLDLIFDLDKFCNEYRGKKKMEDIKAIMLNDYESRGMIKKNPNRKAGDESSVGFLKYESILWRSLGLLVDTGGKPETSFNWKKITEVCSLPDL
jgi:hypothetical protein